MALSDSNIILGLKIKDFSSGLQNATRSLNRASRQWSKVGQQMSMAISAPLTALGALSFSTFANFEQSMAKVKAVSGATGDEFAALESQARKLGESTQFTASQVADLQLNYSKLGFSASEIQQVTAATLDLALATGSDLARSAEVAGATLRGFEMDARETSTVTDIMAKSFSSSALDLEKFAESMKYVAPVAKAAGVDIETTTAMLSALADAGITGSQAGTSLRRIFSELTATGKPLAQALEEVSKRGLNLADAKDEVGRSAQTALLVLSKNQDKIKSLTGTYKNAEGSAREMAAIMENTSQGAMLRMQSALEGLQIELGSLLAKYITPVIEKISELAQKFKNLDEGTKETAVKVGMVAAAIGPVVLVIGKMIAGMRTAIVVIRGFTVALATNPIGMFAAAIGLIVGSLTALSLKMGSARKETFQFTEMATKERGELNALFNVLKNTTEGTNQRKEAIKEINSKYGEYLPSLISEKDTLAEINTAQKLANENILRSIAIKARQNELSAAAKKFLSEESKAINSIRESVSETGGETVAGWATRDFRELVKAVSEAGVSLKQYDGYSTTVFSKGAQDLIAEYAQSYGVEMGLLQESIAGVVVAQQAQQEEMARVNDFYASYLETAGQATLKTSELKRTTEEAAQAMGKLSPMTGIAATSVSPKQSTTSSGGNQMAMRLDVEVEAPLSPIDIMMERMTALKEKADAVASSVAGVFENMGNRLIESLGLADSGFQGFVKSLAGTAIKLISMMLAQSLAQAIFGATSSGAATGPAAVFTTPAFIATAIAGVLGAFAAIPKFADGGILTGPTLGIMGEYAGARTNPEVIAPLDKLQSMMGSGSQQPVVLTTKISGDDIWLVQQRADRKRKRVR